MNEEAEAQRMAMALGMSSFQAQALEYSLVSLYAATFLGKNRAGDKKIRGLMDTRYKHTLGNLIRDAATDLKIPEDIREELEKALLLRNWVTHHFFREFGAVGHSHELRKEATKRLEDAWPFFEEVAGKIHQLVVERLLSSGQSQEQIQAGIQMAVESYVQEST